MLTHQITGCLDQPDTLTAVNAAIAAHTQNSTAFVLLKCYEETVKLEEGIPRVKTGKTTIILELNGGNSREVDIQIDPESCCGGM